METPMYSNLAACLAAPEVAGPYVFACGAGGTALALGLVTAAA
ncbi:hypothetical protein [Clostridium saccharobutylicum]|uniref:Uncharacterized protein n=1 Tax=Clostridium saccharobutylicum TaxID=169679 RepID=A0A1S8N6B5_CLOSA|nr:hypothetical protein [Clostridium saccharobutylicum]OOM11960.1 hypothetical protein CLOSAC_23890 [Clostridium saccharobutylicum]OOM11962.1 hypothetical protein CLOSAC_23910 [Clostridium saccharobutylicum]